MMRTLLMMVAILAVFIARSSKLTAIIDGDWDENPTWDASAPGCYDTIHIPSGITVTITATENYEGCPPMIIIVDGTLQFQNGRKLELPCGETAVIVNGGGELKGGGGGGNSNYIEICGDKVWRAGDGDLTGYILLPIELVAFNAEATKRGVQINWITESELNNDYFILQHSVDAINWVEIAKINGAGNSLHEIEYEFIHESFELHGNYYRLIQVDYDGTKKLYPPIFVTTDLFDRGQNVTVFPNPSTQTSRTIHSEKFSAADEAFFLYDMTGKLVLTNVLTNFNGNFAVIDFGDIQPGNYILQIGSEKVKLVFN